MTRPRDFQRKRVYDWEASAVWRFDRVFIALAKARGERALIPANEARKILLTLPECARLVEQAYPDTTLIPRVTDGRGRRRGSGNKYTVKLPVFSRFPAYVLHEAAHGSKRSEGPHHGPEFVARLIELLVTIEGHDLTHLLRTARKAGLKVADRPYHQWQEAAGPRV